MPKWIHERAKHISAKNPSMSESQAWAIATQQSHALGKSPKNYGTLEGRSTAKAKFDTPKDDKKTANPGHLESEKVAFTLRDAIINPVAGALVGAPIGYAVGDREHPVASALQGAGIGAAAGSLGMPTYLAVKHMDPSFMQMLTHPVVGGPGLAGLGLAGAATLAKRKKTLRRLVGSPNEGDEKLKDQKPTMPTWSERKKVAAVPSDKKMYRRALQLLSEGTHGWHGAGNVANTTAIAESGRLLPSAEGALGEGVYWASKRPDINYFGAGGGVASPLEGIRANKLVEKVREGHQGLRGESFITTNGPHTIGKGDYIIEGFSRDPVKQQAHETAMQHVQQKSHARRISGDALQQAFTDLPMKTAGIAVQYGMDGNPKHAETSDDWLAAHFKSTGTFMVPNRFAASEVAFQQSKYAEVRSEAFLDELGRIALQEMMRKEALDPRLARSLVGAGLGAGVGGATGYVGTKALEDLPTGDNDAENHAGRNAAIGALLGGVSGAGLGYLSGRELHKLHQQVGAGSLSPGVPHDVPPIPLPKDIDPGMASSHEVHGAQQALEHIRASGAVPSPQALPGTDDPGDIYAAINRIQRLEPLTARARAGANPGYLARKGIQARRGIATKFDLGPNETEMALRGKYGEAISPEEAEESLRRYQKLQDQRPTAGQIGRYATLGAVAAPIAGALKNVIVGGDASWSGAKKKSLEGIEGMRRADIHGRILAGTAAAGALTSGALPLVRTHLDQQAEKAKLKEYLAQQLQQPHMPDGDGGELKTGGVGPESGFSKSEYSTPIEGPKRVRQASYILPGHVKVADKRSPETIERAKQRTYGRVAGMLLGTVGGGAASFLASKAIAKRMPGVMGELVLPGLVAGGSTALGALGGWRGGGEIVKALQGAPPSRRKEAGVGPEAGFSGTGYGNTGGYVDFHQVSSLNAPPTQSLQDKPFASPSGGRVGSGPVMVPTVKTAGPLGQFSASAKIGKTPAALAGNNSIASVAKPKGFGQVAVGAKQPVLH